MKPLMQQDPSLESRPSPSLWDTLIRVGAIGVLAVLCYRVFSPFLNLVVWSMILAVTLYPVHQMLARRIGGRQGLTSIILAILGVSLFVVPTWLLMNSFADSIQGIVGSVQQNTVQIPPPSEGVKNWPLVGKALHQIWSDASVNLPGLVQTMQPKISTLARQALSMVASIGSSMLLFLAAFIVANILMTYGDSVARGVRAVFYRIVGSSSGEPLARLVLSTIRAVALGVVGVAAIQALLIGLALLVAGIPLAGILAIIAFVLGILQVPALIITLPVIIYVWASGEYGTAAAIIHTIILLLTGLIDNVLKPLMLGRGVDVPMPVILLGALGGMASGGILGMFVGPVVLALGYKLFTNWVATDPESAPAQ